MRPFRRDENGDGPSRTVAKAGLSDAVAMAKALAIWDRILAPMRAMAPVIKPLQLVERLIGPPLPVPQPLLRVLHAVEELAQAVRMLETELARREPTVLLPGPEQLVAKLPEGSPLCRWEPRRPLERDFSRAGWQFHRLPGPCRQYLTLLGIVGRLAEVETKEPGYYDRLRGGWADEDSRDTSCADWLTIMGTFAIAERPSKQEKLLWAEALFFTLLRFRVRECPGDSRSGPHRWLASPMSRAKVGCPLHGNAIRTKRCRTGLTKRQPRRVRVATRRGRRSGGRKW